MAEKVQKGKKKFSGKKPEKKFEKKVAVKQEEKLDRNGEVIVPPFRVRIVEQLAAGPLKIQGLVDVLSKYDLVLASYTEKKKAS